MLPPALPPASLPMGSSGYPELNTYPIFTRLIPELEKLRHSHIVCLSSQHKFRPGNEGDLSIEARGTGRGLALSKIKSDGLQGVQRSKEIPLVEEGQLAAELELGICAEFWGS